MKKIRDYLFCKVTSSSSANKAGRGRETFILELEILNSEVMFHFSS